MEKSCENCKHVNKINENAWKCNLGGMADCFFEGYIDYEKKEDKVNSPSHYQGKVEVIDYIEDKLTKEGFQGYLEGNIIKYVSRYKKKNGVEDLKKCRWYLERLIKTLEV